jgi:hypothetical protein
MVGGGLHQTPIGNALRDASTLQQRRQVWRGADGQGQPALVAACNYGRRRRRRGRRRVLSCQQAASGVHTALPATAGVQAADRQTDIVRPMAVRRARVEIMGAPKCRNVGESQAVLLMIDPMISTRTRISSALRIDRGSSTAHAPAGRSDGVGRTSPTRQPVQAARAPRTCIPAPGSPGKDHSEQPSAARLGKEAVVAASLTHLLPGRDHHGHRRSSLNNTAVSGGAGSERMHFPPWVGCHWSGGHTWTLAGGFCAHELIRPPRGHLWAILLLGGGGILELLLLLLLLVLVLVLVIAPPRGG